jgi:hypothetical protein
LSIPNSVRSGPDWQSPDGEFHSETRRHSKTHHSGNTLGAGSNFCVAAGTAPMIQCQSRSSEDRFLGNARDRIACGVIVEQ